MSALSCGGCGSASPGALSTGRRLVSSEATRFTDRRGQMAMSPTKSDGKTTSTRGKASGLSPEEIAAMKETLTERRRDASRARGKNDADDEAEVLAKIAELSEHDRSLATRIHALVKA